MSLENSIATYINGTSLPGKDSIDSLKIFTEKYPYSESFTLLYLLALKQNQSFEFEEQLQRHAYRINNREHLYELVIQKSEEAGLQATTAQEHAIEEELLVRPSETDTIEGKEERSKISETLDRINLESEKPVDPLSQEILQHALSSAYELPDLNQEEILDMEKRKIPSLEKGVNNESKESIVPRKDQPLTFSSWLHANQNYTWTNPEEKESVEADHEPKLFGHVERPKTDFFSPAKKAKDSLNESSLPVSETLAKIYVLQGNYPKAISAYEQLILKIPEKKTFFANLIKDLKKQLNS